MPTIPGIGNPFRRKSPAPPTPHLHIASKSTWKYRFSFPFPSSLSLSLSPYSSSCGKCCNNIGGGGGGGGGGGNNPRKKIGETRRFLFNSIRTNTLVTADRLISSQWIQSNATIQLPPGHSINQLLICQRLVKPLNFTSIQLIITQHGIQMPAGPIRRKRNTSLF